MFQINVEIEMKVKRVIGNHIPNISQLDNKFQDIRERVRTVLADLDSGSVTESTAIQVELELEMDLGDDEEHF